jgi:hypothetical protein
MPMMEKLGLVNPKDGDEKLKIKGRTDWEKE